MSLQRRAIAAAVQLSAVALPLGAAADTFYLSQPGLCAASDGVVEEADAIYLQGREISNHYFGCDLGRDVIPALAAGEIVKLTATCSNATTSWTADFALIPQPGGDVLVHQDGAGCHRCAIIAVTRPERGSSKICLKRKFVPSSCLQRLGECWWISLSGFNPSCDNTRATPGI